MNSRFHRCKGTYTSLSIRTCKRLVHRANASSEAWLPVAETFHTMPDRTADGSHTERTPEVIEYNPGARISRVVHDDVCDVVVVVVVEVGSRTVMIKVLARMGGDAAKIGWTTRDLHLESYRLFRMEARA
jgi:hypothetical protein